MADPVHRAVATRAGDIVRRPADTPCGLSMPFIVTVAELNNTCSLDSTALPIVSLVPAGAESP
jgi:hypothetical protein